MSARSPATRRTSAAPTSTPSRTVGRDRPHSLQEQLRRPLRPPPPRPAVGACLPLLQPPKGRVPRPLPQALQHRDHLLHGQGQVRPRRPLQEPSRADQRGPAQVPRPQHLLPHPIGFRVGRRSAYNGCYRTHVTRYKTRWESGVLMQSRRESRWGSWRASTGIVSAGLGGLDGLGVDAVLVRSTFSHTYI